MRERIRGRFDPLSDYQLEAFLCDELGPEERAQVERAAAENPALAQYLQERGAARARFLTERPWRLPQAAEPTPRAGMRAGWSGWRARWWLQLGLAGAALVAVAMPLRWFAGPTAENRPVATRPARPAVRTKGNALRVRLFVKRDGQVFERRAGAELFPGDQVRVMLESPTAGYFTLLSRGANGEVQVYYDQLATQAGRYVVPDSLVLDGTLGEEEWFAVLSTEPRPAPPLIDQLRQGLLPEAVYQRVSIDKRARPQEPADPQPGPLP